MNRTYIGISRSKIKSLLATYSQSPLHDFANVTVKIMSLMFYFLANVTISHVTSSLIGRHISLDQSETRVTSQSPRHSSHTNKCQWQEQHHHLTLFQSSNNRANGHILNISNISKIPPFNHSGSGLTAH